MYLEAEVGQCVLKNVDSLTGLEISLETITDRNGSIVVRAGEKITPEKIEFLKNNGVNKIWVKVEEVLPPLVDVKKNK